MGSRNKFMFDLDVVALQSYNPWPHSPTAKARKLIKPNSRVLDIGCASGYMAEQLKSKGCTVIGIDKDHKAASMARDYCQEVIEADVEHLESPPFPNGFFDVILCLDILEHLIRPDILLSKLKQYLAPNGELIASIPNIARLEHRLRLFIGRFDYSFSGALSKGHLRFFTKKTAMELFINAGYKIKSVKPTGLGSIIKILPNLTAYQFLIVAKPWLQKRENLLINS